MQNDIGIFFFEIKYFVSIQRNNSIRNRILCNLIKQCKENNYLLK